MMLHRFEPMAGYGPFVTTPRAANGADAEPDRIAALKRYGILDTPAEPNFDRITALAADLFDVPVSIIGFVDTDRIFFKSHHGLEVNQVDRDTGGAVPVLRAIGQLADSKAGFRSMSNLPVADSGRLRFGVAVPLRSRDGHDLGVLSVIDRVPILFDAQQLRHLEVYAAIVMDQLDQHLEACGTAAKARVMASETDHRTMNSLQFVASILNLQSRNAQTKEIADQLLVASNRVLAISRVHRHFASSERAERVPILPYLRDLCGELSGIMDTVVTVDGDAVSVLPTQILALGLVTHELVTNAKKHGAGSIRVTFKSDDPQEHELCVADEGDGLPKDFTIEHAGDGLGLRVVAALVNQLKGRLAARPNPAGRGTCFSVTFPSH
jgi:two-component sensor histidine kinase